MQQWNRAELGKLAGKYIQGKATEAEKQTLLEWYNAFDDVTVNVPASDEAEEMLTEARMLFRLRQTIAADKNKPAPRRIPFWVRYSAAALLLGAVSLIIFLLTKPTPPAITAGNKPAAPKQVIVPGGNKAILTLADGSTVILDSVANGTVTTQGGTRIIKNKNGQLTYDLSATANTGTVSYNTITTPRGGQYQVILPDGSKVWLNASSSLRFPTAFTGKSREVSLKGEAYFDISSGAAQPFQVEVNSMQVHVLGTKFNIMAYEDESQAKTTLVQGSVHIAAAGTQPRVLKPGQQARLGKSGSLSVVNDADMDEALAWINGRFYFNDTELSTLMRQIARWYNIEVVYDGAVPQEKFSGEIPRNSNIEEVLKILKLSSIHFTVNGNVLTIKP
jgi:ferric-dicitrate binding protein FerR (iron transport regulator)